MKTNTLLAVVTAVALFGCSTREITLGNASYKSSRLGVVEKFGKIEARSGTNSLTVEGVQSDLVSGFKAGVEAAQKLRP